MALVARSRLKRDLGLLDVYVIATGATLGAAFFVLPGLAVAQAGAGLVLAYVLAAVPLIPAMLSKVELATAMPRAGGTYYFLDRSLGPLIGTIGGFGTWLALILKSSFALIAMGAYLGIFLPDLSVLTVASVFALGLGIVNLFGGRAVGRLQALLVGVILTVIAVFIAGTLPSVEVSNLSGALEPGLREIFATAGLVYVGYIGLTKVISLSEEVRNPERNLPMGVFLAIGTTIVIYSLGTLAMVGVVGPGDLEGDLTPVASTARRALGTGGAVVVAGAAVLAALSVSNAGIISASRYPFAMSRDHLLPRAFRHVGRHGAPTRSVILTTGLILLFLLAMDPLDIAKLAGAFQLLVFALLNVAVIVMRESHLESYDPGFRSPGYPWVQLFGAAAPLVLIASMGAAPILFSVVIIAAGTIWYLGYARRHVARTGAILHVFERLGRERFEGLEVELRGILKEKGLREEDRFEEVVAHAAIIDVRGESSFEDVCRLAASELGERLGHPAETLERGFLEGTRIGATPVEQGVAIPHLRLAGVASPGLLVVRALEGVRVGAGATEPVYALFFLVSPDKNASQHLRFLAQLAVRVEEPDFMQEWTLTRDEGTLRELLLRSERSLALTLREGSPGDDWIGRALRDIDVPRGCLVALVRRRGETIVPQGSTVLEAGDRLIVIGDRAAIQKVRGRLNGS